MLGVGIAALVVSGFLGTWQYAPLIGWDAAALLFGIWTLALIIPMKPNETADHAQREDPTRTTADLLLLAASVASLGAVGVVLVEANKAHGAKQWLLAGLAVGSVALSWLLVHVLYTLIYARLYYAADGTGVQFNQPEPPCYVDFGYLSFTIGMTYQVSDTALTAHSVRSAALRHALMSYLFGAVVLATTVNFIVSLSSSVH
jgi:uncharacterized membrane protein